MTAYYNEIEPTAAATLRELIKAGEIADGEVDTRSIEDVTPNDVKGYTQCHWFAGIGGWSRALRLAGWPDSEFAWTGSCPCQPFSSAGKGAGVNDERHLWPAWMHLIRQCRPSVVFGEQVASAIRLGWLDLVFDDLENSGYACGAAIIPAASVGAPHLRERVWVVGKLADNDSQQRNGRGLGQSAGSAESANGGELGDTQHGSWTPCADGKWRPTKPGIFPLAHGIPRGVGPLVAELGRMGCSAADAKRIARDGAQLLRAASSFRTSQIRGYGNAIVPAVAAEFIRSVMRDR